MQRIDFVTVAEAAQALHRCTKTVRRHLADGSLAGVLVGRQWLIARSTIDQLLAAASR